METETQGKKSRAIAVIGCGNPNRRDDGVGSEVVQALKLRAIFDEAGVCLLDAGTDGMAVMFASRGCESLIVIDACRSGSTPGAIFELQGANLETPHQRSLSLHDFRWDHALFAGRRMFGAEFPSDATVLLIEAANVDFGIGLSQAVAAAAVKVAARVEELVKLKMQPVGCNGEATGPAIVASGSIYLTNDLYASHFAGLSSVAVQRRGDDLLVLPVRHASAGGYLVKRRNARGDRVICAADFLRREGIEGDGPIEASIEWDAAICGLVLEGVFGANGEPAE